MDEIKIDVLDHGFVRLVDTMGTDDCVADAARISYAKGTKRVSNNSGLIRFLLQHYHTSPFEMCVMKFHIKLPMFICRQVVRHRTASINEISGRYSQLKSEYYLPDELFGQSATNKQKSSEDRFSDSVSKKYIEKMRDLSDQAFALYHDMLGAKDENNPELDGVSREIARIILPNNVYTEIIWKMDLNNLMKFINLRTGDGAQYEITEYAKAISKIFQQKYPIIHAAFEEFWQHNTILSKTATEYTKAKVHSQPVEEIETRLNRSDRVILRELDLMAE